MKKYLGGEEAFPKDLDITDRLRFQDEYGSLLLERFCTERENKGSLRMSNLGRPCERQLWYEVNSKDSAETIDAETRWKFFYGDLIEMGILHLVELSGHSVTDQQKEVEILGVKGHIDCIIDGMLVDVKSTTPRGFDKFFDGGLEYDDPFGYLSQLSSYLYSLQNYEGLKVKDKAGFLVVDKTTGKFDLATFKFDLSKKEEEVRGKIEKVASKEVPPRDFPSEPAGAKGNRKLGLNCSYCSFKHTCWPGLRTFAYKAGKGVRYEYLTEVKSLPKVEEV